MKTLAFPTRTICGIDELPAHGTAGVTHVLSITDPGWPELPAFDAYSDIRITKLQFHDVIDPGPGLVLPAPAHMEAILRFGRDMDASAEEGVDGHLLVHCHMGISRSTAAMVTLMALAEPEMAEDEIYDRLRAIRPQAWPNSMMVAMADEMLGRRGRLTEGLKRHYARQIAEQPALVRMIEGVGRSREIEMGERARTGVGPGR